MSWGHVHIIKKKHTHKVYFHACSLFDASFHLIRLIKLQPNKVYEYRHWWFKFSLFLGCEWHKNRMRRILHRDKGGSVFSVVGLKRRKKHSISQQSDKFIWELSRTECKSRQATTRRFRKEVYFNPIHRFVFLRMVFCLSAHDVVITIVFVRWKCSKFNLIPYILSNNMTFYRTSTDLIALTLSLYWDFGFVHILFIFFKL